jgi:hypothetical protein
VRWEPVFFESLFEAFALAALRRLPLRIEAWLLPFPPADVAKRESAEAEKEAKSV